MTDTPTANNMAITRAVNILGAAEGLRPRAEMLAKALAMMTAMGPRMHKVKINTNAMFRDML